MTTRTLNGWVHYLTDPDAQLTLEEFAVLCALHTRENVKDARFALQHLEGVIGTIEEFLALDPRYQQIAHRRGRSATQVALPGPDGA